jgi:hypothetical protein
MVVGGVVVGLVDVTPEPPAQSPGDQESEGPSKIGGFRKTIRRSPNEGYILILVFTGG